MNKGTIDSTTLLHIACTSTWTPLGVAATQPEPVEIGIAVLARLACPDGEEADLRPDPTPLAGGERLAHRYETLAVGAVTEMADRALRHLHAQVESVAADGHAGGLFFSGMSVGVLADGLRNE